MKLNQIAIFILFLLFLSAVKGQEYTYNGDPDTSYFTARELAFAGNRSDARDTLKLVLSRYPEYVDVRSLLAKTYSWDQEFDKARAEFNAITSKERKNKEVWIGAIKNEQYANNLHIALGMANKALVFLEDDMDILQIKTEIVKQIADTQLLQNKLKATKIAEEKKQAFTVYTEGEVFDQVLDPMYYGAIEYRKETKWGVLLPRINFNRRFNLNGLQAEIDAYPKISKSLSGYFNYGFSNSEIFPRHRVGAEIVKELPNALEASLGLRHLSFATDEATILTGSFGLYRGNYYASLRPFVVPDAVKGLGVSGSLLVRRYFKDGNNWLGMNLGYGFDTEMNQFIVDGELLAQTLLYLEAQRVRLEYQFTRANNSNQYKVNVGVNRQELAFSSGNFFLSVTAGLSYQVKFK
ncbi:YaiO family outer membrane beta-barrel protein [Maribacter chungangensis]|uniref:YaiO family outer membrane beta-barrel protein n=1 Tax=Maribacter chungangensis TaxID=1069117 RepID=A0ABW3B419_9FLAO